MSAVELGTFFTGVIAVLTFLYVWTTRAQLMAMRDALAETRRSNSATEKSNEIAERALELGKRAWLVANFTTMPGSSHAFAIELHNVGGVPATDITIWHRSGLWPHPELPETLPRLEQQRPDVGMVIGAGRSYLTAAEPIEASTDAEVEAVENGRAVRYYHCEIEYRDVFGKPRKTVACWVFGLDRSSEVDWILAPKHNRLE